jgi:hypothetical protein
MGHIMGYADTVEDKFVREICPDEIDKLQKALDGADCTWDSLASCANYDDLEGELSMELGIEDEHITKIVKAYDELFQAFQKKTGLDLELKYHDSGDKADGFFWTVDGVYTLSSAGKKYIDKIERKFWTTYG